MGLNIAFTIFVAIAISYLYIMKIQGSLKEGEWLIYKENKVNCTFKSPFARMWYRRNIKITDKRVIEEDIGLCVRIVTLNPNIKDKFGIVNVLHADTTKITTDEKGQECFELSCKSGNITRHFTIRYYLKDIPSVNEKLRKL